MQHETVFSLQWWTVKGKLLISALLQKFYKRKQVIGEEDNSFCCYMN